MPLIIFGLIVGVIIAAGFQLGWWVRVSLAAVFVIIADTIRVQSSEGLQGTFMFLAAALAGFVIFHLLRLRGGARQKVINRSYKPLARRTWAG